MHSHTYLYTTYKAKLRRGGFLIKEIIYSISDVKLFHPVLWKKKTNHKNTSTYSKIIILNFYLTRKQYFHFRGNIPQNNFL